MKLINGAMIKNATKAIEGAIKKNAPQILAGVGIAFGLGAVGGAVHATVRAVKIVEEKEAENDGEKLTKKEIVKETWKLYVPTAVMTAASAACVVGSVHISMRRLATMTMAYAMSENSFKEYKEKAKELLGEKKEEEIRGAVNQEHVQKNLPEDDSLIIRTGGGTTKCLDKFTGQVFYSDADTIRRVINNMNNCLLHDYYVSLDDLNTELGIRESKFGGSFGWNINDGDLIEPSFTVSLTPDDEPVLVLDYIVGPHPNFRTLNI